MNLFVPLLMLGLALHALLAGAVSSISSMAAEMEEMGRLMGERSAQPGGLCLGDNTCCHSGNLCTFGEGDCGGDGSDSCLGFPSMVCGRNNCKDMLGDGSGWSWRAGSFSATDDCCTLRPELLKFAVDNGFFEEEEDRK